MRVRPFVAAILGRARMEDGNDIRQVRKELELIRLQLQIIVAFLTDFSANTQKSENAD